MSSYLQAISKDGTRLLCSVEGNLRNNITDFAAVSTVPALRAARGPASNQPAHCRARLPERLSVAAGFLST